MGTGMIVIAGTKSGDVSYYKHAAFIDGRLFAKERNPGTTGIKQLSQICGTQGV